MSADVNSVVSAIVYVYVYVCVVDCEFMVEGDDAQAVERISSCSSKSSAR